MNNLVVGPISTAVWALRIAGVLLLTLWVVWLVWGLTERWWREETATGQPLRDAPPAFLRLMWWPVQAMAVWMEQMPHDLGRLAMQPRLRQAGLEFCVNATEFATARLFSSLSLGTAGVWFLAFAGHAGALGLGYGGQASGLFSALVWTSLCLASGWALPAVWLSDLQARRRMDVLRAMPFYLDIITLCVEAGLSIQSAIAQAVAKGPKGHVRDEFQRVLRDIRAGKARADALRDMGQRLAEPTVTNFTACVVQADKMGMSLGPLLRTQADQRLDERFMRAEKKAFQAPVKMIFPLALFIFPCTFVVLLFPVVVKVMGQAH